MYETREFDSAQASRDLKKFFQDRLLLMNPVSRLDSRLHPKLISNDLGRLYRPPMSLLSRRKVPQLDRTNSGRPFHRGRKFMYRLTEKAIRFIKNTRLDLIDTSGLASLKMSASAQEMYRDSPIEVRFSPYAPKSLSIAFGERKFPKPRKAKEMVDTAPRSDTQIATTELLRTAMVGNELRNLRDGTPEATGNPLATRNPLSANDQIEKLWNDVRELQKAWASRSKVKQAGSSQELLQTGPSGQLWVSWELFFLQSEMLLETMKIAQRARTQGPSSSLRKKQELEAEGYIVEYPTPVWVLQEKALKNIEEIGKRRSEEVAKKRKSEDELIEGLELVQPFIEAAIEEGAAYIRKRKADAKLAKDEGPSISTTQEAPNRNENQLIRRTQLFLVHEVVESKSRMTLDNISAKLGVPREQLMPILPLIVEGLDLVLEEYDGSFSVRHRNWKHRGMPESERHPTEPG